MILHLFFFERTARGLPNILIEGEKTKYRDYWPARYQLQPIQEKEESEKKRKKQKPPLENSTTKKKQNHH
jgi:hypothetical protein